LRRSSCSSGAGSRRAPMCSTASGTGVRLVRNGRVTSNSTEPRIRLLGGFSVAVGYNLVADRAWRLRKAKALVKILASAPDRRGIASALPSCCGPSATPTRPRTTCGPRSRR
jgi:hypothetical protein